MSIFICNNCKNEYDKTSRKPLSLPCGHVYCQKCISYIYNFQDKALRCPSDNLTHFITIDKIPKCVQIYSNLPTNKELQTSPPSNSPNLYCQRHSHKKIKFFCKTHKSFLCSICVIDHTDHQVTKIHIDKTNFEEELKSLCNHIIKAKNAFIIKKGKLEKYETKINNYYKLQLKDIEMYFAKLNDIIKCRKNELLMFYNKILTEQNHIFMQMKNQTMAITDLFIDIGNKESIIKKELFPKGNYEKFYIMKNNIETELNKIHTEYDERKIKIFKFIPGIINSDTLGNIVDIKEKKIIHHINHNSIQNAGNSNKQSNCNNIHNNNHLCFDGVDDYKCHLNNSFETISSLSQYNNTNGSVINVFKNNLLSKKEIPSNIQNHNFIFKSIETKPSQFNNFLNNNTNTIEDIDKKRTSNTTGTSKNETTESSTSKTSSTTNNNNDSLSKANINTIKQNVKPLSSRDVGSIIKKNNNNGINIHIQCNKKLISPNKNENPVIVNKKKQNGGNMHSQEMMTSPSTGFYSGNRGNEKQFKGNKLLKNYSNYNRNVIKTENEGDANKNRLRKKGSVEGKNGEKKRNFQDVRLSVNGGCDNKQKRGNSYTKNEILVSDGES